MAFVAESGAMATELHQTLHTGAIDLRATLGITAFLAGDPTVRLSSSRYERATHTPDGPASIRIEWDTEQPGTAEVSAWGDGAEWMLDSAPGLVGLLDDPSGFEPHEGKLRQLWKRHRDARICRTATFWHDAAWTIIQQRVTTVDASQQWRALSMAVGSPAPGPVELRLPAKASAVAAMHYTDFHRFGVERQRAEYLRLVASRAVRLQTFLDVPFHEAQPALASLRGVGPWTQTMLATQTWGDPDAVVVGDDGIPSMVTWFLAGERRGTDQRMLELLEPFRPHRQRVVRLVFASGVTPPRRHHRYARNPIHRI